MDVVFLTRVFRQKDNEFIKLLDQVRTGTPSEAVIQRLKQICRPSSSSSSTSSSSSSSSSSTSSTLPPSSLSLSIRPTRLHTHNADVARVNEEELRNLPGSAAVYVGEGGGGGVGNIFNGL